MIKYIALFFVAFVVLFIAGISFYLSPDNMRSCEQPEPVGQCSSADAIVAVSGGDTNARVDQAITLYQAGWAPKLIFSGAAADPDSPSNAASMQRRAVEAGVPMSAVIIEEFSRTTEENAENTAEFIDDQSISRIILVTSAYHQRRALLEFRAILGPEITILNHPVPTDKQWAGVWWWTTPRGWWLAGGELIKVILFYAVPGDDFVPGANQ